jgi:hypothetical protein
MAITVVCACGRTLPAKDEHAGIDALCPGCGATLRVPAAGPPPSSFRCTVCNGWFAAADVYDDHGRIVCDRCYARSQAGPPQFDGPSYAYSSRSRLRVSVGYAAGGYGAGTNGPAVASMVPGILSLALCHPFVTMPCAILAIIFGFVGVGQTRRTYSRGGGMAVAGIVCGIISIALVVLGLALVFGLLLYRR